MALATIIYFAGCNRESKSTSENITNEKEIVQQSDGQIQLNIEDAYLLSDEDNPSSNTAEWRIKVLNKGRYEVWLTSLTQDTMDLHYEAPVIVNFEDKKITGKPIGNEIVLDDNDVHTPYFRADSKLGSIYIEDPGQYNIQVVSDKLRKGSVSAQAAIQGSQTILRSLVLKPLTQ